MADICCAIPLTKGSVALVDERDFIELNKYKWYADTAGYACRDTQKGGKRQHLYMHRVILGVQTSMETDHINGNKSDNRRNNLRLVTGTQNSMNRSKTKPGTSQYKGVSLSMPPRQKTTRWAARVKKAGQLVYREHFTSEVAAAKAYDKAAKHYHGKYARLNFSEDI